MAWWRRKKEALDKDSTQTKVSIPKGLWSKCESCGEITYTDELIQNLRVCPVCGHHGTMPTAERIATTVDAGTRVCRFMIQDLLGTAIPSMAETRSWTANLVATGLAVTFWGYFLYQGVVDPLGGINTLWPLFGISNQMLAAIAQIGRAHV